MASQCPAAEMITVPGAVTAPSSYCCFMDRESLPVGMLMPNSVAKEAQASTAAYSRASSPWVLQGHIQLADRDTAANPFSSGAQTMFVNASAIALRLPFLGSINPLRGAWPMAVATPDFPW